MKAVVVAIVFSTLLSSCAGMQLHKTKWECATSADDCLPKARATNKCLAMANAAFNRNKISIWEQCMQGEGFIKIQCYPDEPNPDCAIFHVW